MDTSLWTEHGLIQEVFRMAHYSVYLKDEVQKKIGGINTSKKIHYHAIQGEIAKHIIIMQSFHEILITVKEKGVIANDPDILLFMISHIEDLMQAFEAIESKIQLLDLFSNDFSKISWTKYKELVDKENGAFDKCQISGDQLTQLYQRKYNV